MLAVASPNAFTFPNGITVGTQTDNPRTGPYRSCTKAFVIGG